MITRWILSVLLAPLSRERSIPLVRPIRIDWNPSLSPQTIQIKGHAIFYIVKGEGEPLLLIHGYGAGSLRESFRSASSTGDSLLQRC